jgi:hypothetical protein
MNYSAGKTSVKDVTEHTRIYSFPLSQSHLNIFISTVLVVISILSTLIMHTTNLNSVNQ